MAEYRISGVWKDSNHTITHYGIHTATDKGFTRVVKRSKQDVINIVESKGNIVKTWTWNYSLAFWHDGEDVHVVHGSYGKFLRSNPDKKITDNLAHLINYNWIIG